MANEGVIVELHGNNGDPMSFTCADGVGIEKGTLLWYSDPRTISGASINGNDGSRKPFAGIANAEKVASDGSTKIGVYTRGVFDLTTVASPTVNVGDYLVISGQNLVASATGTSILSGANIIGVALETASASEVIQVRLGR